MCVCVPSLKAGSDTRGKGQNGPELWGGTEHVEAETDVVGGGYREERLNGLCYEQTMEFREFDRLFIDDLIEGR